VKRLEAAEEACRFAILFLSLLDHEDFDNLNERARKSGADLTEALERWSVSRHVDEERKLSSEQDRMRKSTMVELPALLRRLPPLEAIIEIIHEAEAGEYHDYKNQKYVCGKVALVDKLRKAATEPMASLSTRRLLEDIAQRVIDGEFDEEADEEDLAALRKICPPELRAELGLEDKG
jgi:hypothetical protein